MQGCFGNGLLFCLSGLLGFMSALGVPQRLGRPARIPLTKATLMEKDVIVRDPKQRPRMDSQQLRPHPSGVRAQE